MINHTSPLVVNTLQSGIDVCVSALRWEYEKKSAGVRRWKLKVEHI